MATTVIGRFVRAVERSDPVTAIPATHTATAAPGGATDALNSGGFRRVRTLVAFANSVTSCRIRLWVKHPASGLWFRGASTDDGTPLAPASVARESRDWDVGRDAEFMFQVEAISPGTAGNTVQVDVVGVEV